MKQKQVSEGLRYMLTIKEKIVVIRELLSFAFQNIVGDFI